MSGPRQPHCKDSINYILGYIIWKKEILDLFYEQALNASGLDRSSRFIRQEKERLLNNHNVLTNTFYWKETYQKKANRINCELKEYYNHFHLNFKFDNDSYSFTQSEPNLDTGSREEVLYKIEKTDNSFEKTIINAIGKTLNINFDGISSLNDLESKKPVPLPLRKWRVNGKDIIARLVGGSYASGHITLSRPWASINGSYQAQTVQVTDAYTLAENRTYILNNENNITYNQQRNHIIIFEPSANKFTISESDHLESYSTIREYNYNPTNKFFTTGRVVKKHIKPEPAVVSLSGPTTIRERIPVIAKVSRTTPDGCKGIYEMVIGHINQNRYIAKYYGRKNDTWEPKKDDKTGCVVNDIIKEAISRNVTSTSMDSIINFLNNYVTVRSGRPTISTITRIVGDQIISVAYRITDIIFNNDTLRGALTKKVTENLDSDTPFIEFGTTIDNSVYSSDDWKPYT